MLSKFFGNSGKDLGKLFKSSMDLFADRGVLEPAMKSFGLSIFNHTLFIVATLMVMYDQQTFWAFSIFALQVIVLFPYSFFYSTRMKACQAWMVYAAITNKTSTFEEAHEITQKQKWTLRLFAFIELIFSMKSSKNESKENKGIIAFIASVVFSAFETIFDVAEDYLLPATVIEQKPIQETIGKLEQLKLNIPASLSGAFGFDIFGQAISSFTYFVHILILAAGAVVGFALTPIVPEHLLTNVPSEIVQSLNFIPNHIFLAPVFVAFGLSSLLHRAVKISVSSLKNIYFSVFYTSINRPLEIKSQLRDSLTHYLNCEDESYVKNIKKQFSSTFSELSKGTEKVQKTDAQIYEVIEKTFTNNIAKGHSVESIADFLKKKGYPEQAIKEVIVKLKRIA
jgi:hypothetical protein